MRRTLDTNICSYVLRRHPSAMLERFAHLPREQLWLSAIVAAELRFGAAKLASPRFSAAVEAWLAGFDVRPWPVAATAHYEVEPTHQLWPRDPDGFFDCCPHIFDSRCSVAVAVALDDAAR